MFQFRNHLEQKRLNEKVRRQQLQQAQNQPKCPKCGSTNLGSNKTVNRCANCGHMWKP